MRLLPNRACRAEELFQRQRWFIVRALACSRRVRFASYENTVDGGLRGPNLRRFDRLSLDRDDAEADVIVPPFRLEPQAEG